MADSDFLHSSRRENLIEHLFIGEVLRQLWLKNIYEVDVLRAETDAAGYDIVIEVEKTSRHIQLKSSSHDATANSQKVNIALLNKPAGCVVWVQFEPKTMKLGPFLWFGNVPDQPMSDISKFRIAKQTKANSKGVKTERKNIRVIPKGKFTVIPTIVALNKILFG